MKYNESSLQRFRPAFTPFEDFIYSFI